MMRSSWILALFLTTSCASAQPSIRCVFLSEDGAPLANVPASADLFPPPSFQRPPIGSQGSTDEQGQFLVFLPDQNPWWIVVSVSGAAFFIDASEPKRLPTSVKCWLGEKPSTVCSFHGDASKVAIFLRLANSSWWVRLLPSQDGQLLLFRLPVGRHQLVLTPSSVQAYFDGIEPLQPPVSVEVKERQTTTVIFTLPAMGAMVGEVRSADGNLLSSVTVSLERRGINQMTAITDRSGRFRFDGVPEGDYRLIVLAREFESWTKTVRVKANEMVTVTAILRPQSLGIVRGRVVGADGIIPQIGHIFVDRILSPLVLQPVSVWTWIPDGRFEGKLPAGTYSLTAQMGGRRAKKRVKVTAEQVTHVGDIVLPSPAIVEGMVKNIGRLSPLRVQVVVLEGSSDITQPQWTSLLTETPVGADGRFQIEVPPEPVALLLHPFGKGKPLVKRLHAKEGERVQVTFELPRMGAIEGQVIRADIGQPVVGATVTLLDEIGTVVGKVFTNQSGDYRFELVLPGRYSVRCQVKGLAMGFRHEVNVRAGERVPIDFVLSVGATIVGRVKTSKTPLTRFYVLVDADTNLASKVSSDGSFRIDHITQGRHIIFLFWLGEQVSAKEVIARSGETTEVVFELP